MDSKIESKLNKMKENNMHKCDIEYQNVTRQNAGVYVDCGANNGVFLSKTKDLDDKGWVGFCIEANPEQYKNLVKNRPNATCINTAIYDVDNINVTLSVDSRGTGGGSTLLPPDKGAPSIRVNSSVQCKSQTLNSIFKKNNITSIDFLKVDLEGVDAKALLALNLDEFDIKFICYEQFPKLRDSQEYKKLEDKLTKAGFVKLKKLREVTEYFVRIDVVWLNENKTIYTNR